MCNIVVINRGQKEISTPREFFKHFGFMPDLDFNFDTQGMDECLCNCDIERELIKKGIEFTNDCGDIHVPPIY